MNRLTHYALLIAVFGAIATAQTGNTGSGQLSPQEAHSSIILDKLAKVDVLGQYLPLLLTKEQLKALLPTIEKARENVATVKRKEYEELKKIEPMLDKAIANGVEKSEVPKREEVAAAMNMVNKLYVGRSFIAASNATLVAAKFREVASKGQLKTAANSLDPRFLPAGKKAEDVTDDEKIDIFVREILLHPQAYDVMRKQSL